MEKTILNNSRVNRKGTIQIERKKKNLWVILKHFFSNMSKSGYFFLQLLFINWAILPHS